MVDPNESQLSLSMPVPSTPRRGRPKKARDDVSRDEEAESFIVVCPRHPSFQICSLASEVYLPPETGVSAVAVPLVTQGCDYALIMISYIREELPYS